ncbi:MAG: collagen binding domain-containing protein, partial [Clostridia bacterium]
DLQTNYKLIFAGGQHSKYFENGDKFDKMYKGEKGILVKTNYFREREKISPKNFKKLKVEYDIEKISEPDKLAYTSGNIVTIENWESKYMAIGPITFNVGLGDWLNDFKVTYKDNEGNSHTVQPTEENDVVKLLGWTTEGKWMEFTAQDFNEFQKENYMHKISSGYCYKINQEPILYLLVKKDAKITEISKVYMEIGRQELSGKFQLLKSKTGGQELLYGNGKTWESKHPMEFSVEPLISPVQVELDKVDTAGDAVEGAKFSIEYSNGLKGETKTVGKDGKITFSQIQPTSPDEFTATITETYTPAGYKPLDKPIILTFTYDQNNAIWKVTKTSGPSEKVEIGTVSKDSKSGINKIPVTVENKSIIEKLTLSKTSSVGGGKLAGAKFKLTLTNVASIKNHQIPEAGKVTIIETTNSDGNLVLEDIEIKNLNEPVVITIEEIEAPVGYKKIEGTITVTLKRKGNTYTIHKAEKEDTVTDDEFEAGEVTLKNHELELKIKDIPVMNLGGIVWTEKIKTGKEQPDINNTYSESDDEALGGVEVRLLDGNNNVIATTTTAKQDGEKVTYLNNLGKEVTVELKPGQ